MTLSSILLSLGSLALSVFAIEPHKVGRRQTHLNKRGAEWNAVQPKLHLLRTGMLAGLRVTWEQGIVQDALLELDYPDLGPFGASPFKSNTVLPVSVLQAALSSVIKSCDDGRVASTCEDSSQLDGISAAAGIVIGEGTQKNGAVDWKKRTDLLISFIMERANRVDSGALSHKNNEKTLWADGAYMSSGAIAAIGYARNDNNLLDFGYRNVKLYRDALFNETLQLWEHINGEYWSDKRIWATGNSWALAGMIRLKVAILKSEYASLMRKQTDDLLTWSLEIVNGMLSHLGTNGLVKNFIEVPADQPTAFGDSAASAFLAWSIYRLAPLVPDKVNATHIAAADAIRLKVLDLVSELGQLQSATDVLLWDRPGVVSAEANAMALLMMAAYRDYSHCDS